LINFCKKKKRIKINIKWLPEHKAKLTIIYIVFRRVSGLGDANKATNFSIPKTSAIFSAVSAARDDV
jgi:hypothetical protein